MASTFTPNIGLELPANGDDVGTWDVPVNGDFTLIDTALGGFTTLNVVAASGTVTLTATQYRPRIIYVTGALTADVNYQFPANVGGTWTVINQTTGSHTITFSSAGAGTSVTISQQAPSIITCDATNVRTASTPPTKYSIANNGYYTLPFGLILEWGKSGNISGGGSQVITLPLAMPNNLFSVQITPINSGSPTLASYVTGTFGSGAATNFQINNGNSSTSAFLWTAIGN